LAALLDLGALGYLECWARQKEIVAKIQADESPETLVFVEHPAVYTLGASFHESNFLFDRDEYARRGVDIQSTDRGGDITYHGPNQLVIYPLFDIRRHGKDLHKWLRDLEETIIQVAQAYGLEGKRSPVNTGVWVGVNKVAAIGIKVSRWVSLHGIALNCNNDLTPFEWIVPCGIEGYGVTSLSKELGRDVPPNEVKPKVVKAFENVFDMTFHEEAPTCS
jgi:lipoyl(octanoyl) transferase